MLKRYIFALCLTNVFLVVFTAATEVNSECDECTGCHEVVDTCVQASCSPRNCSQLGKPIPCPRINPAYCRRGCVCENGYLRDDCGNCIPKSQCPACNDDPNAVSGCSMICSKWCPGHRKKNPVACSDDICEINGCVCRSNYVYDYNMNRCVRPKDCTRPCGSNEVYSGCTNGGCDPRNCTQLGKPVPCVKLDPASCIKGCVCASGYLRNSNGICVPTDKCPPTCLKNEVYSNCSNQLCRFQNCAQYGYPPLFCPRYNASNCKPGCICPNNYLRNSAGICIPEDQCPEATKCKKNEVSNDCVNSVCTWVNCSQIGKPIPCAPKPPPCGCKKGCLCKDGYLRDDSTGVCIPQDQCPPACLRNDVYSNCSNGLCRFENCTQYGDPIMFCPRFNTSNCKPGCICPNNYLRNSLGICIPEDECPEAQTTAPATCTNGDALQRLIIGILKFSTRSLYQIILQNIGTSIAVSPVTLLILLAQLFLYTKEGDSYNQLADVLNLNSKDEVRCTIPQMLDSFASQNDTVLTFAAKVYVSNIQNLTEQFKEDSEKILDSTAETIDFSNAQKAADIINAWVQQQTRNLINNLVSASMFSKYTRLVLVDAMYFLGDWDIPFNPNKTTSRPFYLNGNSTVQKATMYREGTFNYTNSTELDAQIIQIPYKGGDLNYYAVIPNQIDGYLELSNKLQDPNVINNAMNQMESQYCRFYLPKYQTTSSVDMANIIEKLNVTDIFNPSTSDLEGVLENNEDLFVSAIVTKTNITVNELGTVAASATGVIVGTTAVRQSIIVDANRPFFYFIFRAGYLLFLGLVTGD